jgi:hypothetical protein
MESNPAPLLLCHQRARVVDGVRDVDHLGARLGPTHHAVHRIAAARLDRLDLGRPLHQRGLDLEPDLVGDPAHDLAVYADQLAVLEPVPGMSPL